MPSAKQKACSKAGKTLSTSKDAKTLSLAGTNLANCRWHPEKVVRTKPRAKPDAKPRAKPDAKPDAKPRAKPDAKPRATIMNKSFTQTNAITELRNKKNQYVVRSPYIPPYRDINDLD